MKTLYKTMLMAAAAAFIATGAYADNYGDKSSKIRDSNMNQSSSVDMDKDMQDDMLDASEVRDVQQALRDQGHSVAVDGIWGPQTTEAIRMFQRNNNLSATGNLDTQTLAKLDVDIKRYNN